MAPEQFLGERGDERSDQFSFCVALYEALYGERPFAGNDFLSISVNVTTEQLRPLPKDRDVPAWIRRLILRGLKADPAARWESMATLIRALGRRSRHQAAPALHRRWDDRGRRRQPADRVADGVAPPCRGGPRDCDVSSPPQRRDAGTARAAATKALELRKRSFAAFDAMNRDEGEASWKQARTLLPAIDAGYDQAERAFESAFTLDPSRSRDSRAAR